MKKIVFLIVILCTAMMAGCGKKDIVQTTEVGSEVYTTESRNTDSTEISADSEEVETLTETQSDIVEDALADVALDGVWLQRDTSDAMQFIFDSDDHSVRYYATQNNGSEYTTTYSLENDELKISMVNLDGNGITDLYFDVNYSEDETFKILTIDGSSQNDEIDTSNLYGMDDLIDGTYVQIKESWVKSLLGVPEDLDTDVIHGEASYWLAADMYVIYYEIMKDNDCIATAGIDALTGELAKDIRTYSN